jgi:hypothetical protein
LNSPNGRTFLLAQGRAIAAGQVEDATERNRPQHRSGALDRWLWPDVLRNQDTSIFKAKHCAARVLTQRIRIDRERFETVSNANGPQSLAVGDPHLRLGECLTVNSCGATGTGLETLQSPIEVASW